MAKKRSAKRIKRASPVQNMVVDTGRTMAANSGALTIYVNAAHLLSMMNRKAYHQVTRSGHLKNYGLEVNVYNMVNASTSISTAPLSYVTYNATRAWHFARKERYEDAGFKLSDLGYGSRLRFAMDAAMSAIPQSNVGGDGDATQMLKPSALDHTITDKGEWDWSDVIITPPVQFTDTGAAPSPDELSDSFILHLLGDHVSQGEDETLMYTSVGMNQSWVENRRGWAAPSAEEVMQPENPLAFARASDLSSYQLSTEVSDEQKQSPPYSNEDDDDAKSAFATAYVQGTLESKFPNPTTNNDIIVAPGGVAKIVIANNDTGNAAYPFINVRIFELD